MPESGGNAGTVAMLVGGGTMLFTLRQEGSVLTGTVEGTGGGFFGGGDTPAPITDGKIDGQNVSFKAGNNTYSGTMKADQIELQRKVDLGFPLAPPAIATGHRPAIGPPPDGSDPSRSPSFRISSAIPLVIRRVQR